MNKWIITISLALLGCDPGSAIDATPEAKDLAAVFIDNFSPDKVDKLIPLYGEEFWGVMPKETWVKILPNVYEELGPIESCDLSNWKQSTQASTSGSGNFVTLVYSCKHAKYDSSITFTILKPLSGGPAKIVGQNFSSLGLLIE